MARKKRERVDGLSPRDEQLIRSKAREVWNWSYPRKLCLQRATDKDGFGICEQCFAKVPKVYADHIKPVGSIDNGFLKRLFCPSKDLQALCLACHKQKTKDERIARNRKKG